MTFNKIQNEIITAIRSANGIRWASLKRIIVNDKKICSERIFRQTLNKLVENEAVFKREITRQHVEYYVEQEIENFEQTFNEWYKKSYSQLDFVIGSIKKNRTKIPLTDLSGLIVTLWRILSNFSLLITTVILVHEKPDLAKGKDLQLLFKKLLLIISQTKSKESKVELWDFVSRFLTYEMNELSKLVKKDLTQKQIPWTEPTKTS